MLLSPGDRLGPYEVVALLGEGGMGAVYRARDSRLERQVAIKVLHQDAIGDAHRRQRFIQEARTVSTLSHPNIVAVYDIGTEGDVVYLVMELVDGQPLDTLIPSAGLRLSEVLRIGAHIADACAHAHAAGIVHRDLKPANIMLQRDGRTKVLDFGIAKLVEPVGVDPLRTREQNSQTTKGMVLGTAAYMSPEQAEGRTIDGRSDIFSLGAVLYELTTGQRAFRGDSPLSVMAAVLQQEPQPPGDLRKDLPPELGRIVMRCLRKDPARRVQSMADLAVALEELREEVDSGKLTARLPAAPTGAKRPSVLAAAAVGAIAVGVVVGWWAVSGPAAPEATPQVGPLTSYPGAEGSPSFSPDGSQIAFTWNGEQEDNQDVYVSLIGSGSPLRLTADPRPDFGSSWSPDGRSIAFLRRLDRDSVAVLLVPPLGGPERKIGEFGTRLYFQAQLASLCWTPDSRHLLVSGSQAPNQANRILRVPVDGGDIKVLAATDDAIEGYAYPALSADGRTLAMVRSNNDDRTIELLSLSDTFEPGDVRKVPEAGSNVGRIAWTADSRDLIFSSVLNVPQSLYRIRASGGTATTLPWVGPGASGIAMQGTRMAFVRNYRDVNIVRVEVDTIRNGTPIIDRIAQSSFREVAPAYSPDGTRLAFYSNRGGSIQIWTSKADGSQAAPLTSMDPLATTGTPRWSPDGRQIAFDSSGGGSYQIYTVSADGGRPHALTSGAAGNYIAAWSPDGRSVYFSSDRNGQDEIWRVPSAGGNPEQVTRTGGTAPTVSPDGRWLYFTKEDGAGGLWRMPVEGGQPTRVLDGVYRYNFVVTRDGIYYVTPEPSPVIRFLNPVSGVSREIIPIDKPVDLGLAVSPDGKYLLFTQVDYAGQDLMLVENFK
jgi:Tol biopolymer transport system component/tRNA A-37 threonylcarbamoyl transferase component Bud32